MYVTIDSSNSVAIIDTTTNSIVGSVTVGSTPAGVAVNTAGTRAYAASCDANQVTVIDTTTNTAIATVTVGACPGGLAVNPAGTRVYVANSTSNNVSAIDTATNKVVATIPVGSIPIALGRFIGPDTGVLENYQGLWWAAAGVESGWGVNFAHQGDRVFATWYTYDTGGNAYWLSMLASRTTPTSKGYTGDVYVDVGPPFNNFVGSGTASKVGTGILTFSDANNGSFSYSITAGGAGNVTQSKSIARYVLDGSIPQTVCTYSSKPNLTAATNYQDLWWVSTESGWGVNFAHQGDLLFATWYTYDQENLGPSNPPLWLSALLRRQGTSNVFSGPITRTSGPRFDNYKFSDLTPALVVGNATAAFANGNVANFGYVTTGAGSLPAVSQSKSISRFLFAGQAGTVCH
jgi:YVTN family beta-propeller protein